MSFVPWSASVADTPLARLAWELQAKYRWDYPPHLAVEALAGEIAARFELAPPVTVAAGLRVLRGLGIDAEITRTGRGDHGAWTGSPAEGRFTVVVSDRDAETRQTLTCFHEFYELLRAHLHAFDCAPFPEGMQKTHYVPERMARRFSAAIGLPREYVAHFLREHGLDVPLLVEQSGRSAGSVVRRLRELISGGRQLGEAEPHPDDAPLLGTPVPFLTIRCGLRASLLARPVPQFKCLEHVRSPQFSLRQDRHGSREYLIPRKDEEWAFGPLAQRVLESGAPAYACRVTGFDLFGMRDLCALAVPERENDHLVAIALYAIPAEFAPLWDSARDRLQCSELPRVAGLAGAPGKVRRVSGRHGDLIDVREGRTLSGKPLVAELYAPVRLLRPDESEGEKNRAAAQLGFAFA